MHAGSGLHRPADRASPFEHTRAPCARSDLGSCSSADEGLARQSEAADAAERSERACRCYRRTGSSTLDGRGHQGRCGLQHAAVWPRSMWSGSSAQLASKLVWWPPWHGVWPVPCSQGHIMYGLGPEEVNRLVLSVCRRAGAGQEPRAGPRKFGQNPRSRRRLLVATCAPAYDPN